MIYRLPHFIRGFKLYNFFISFICSHQLISISCFCLLFIFFTFLSMWTQNPLCTKNNKMKLVTSSYFNQLHNQFCGYPGYRCNKSLLFYEARCLTCYLRVKHFTRYPISLAQLVLPIEKKCVRGINKENVINRK